MQETDSPRTLYRESLIKAVAALQAVTPFDAVVLSGRLLENEPSLLEELLNDLARFGEVNALGSMPGAWVKHAAQGAALVANGLAGGIYSHLVEHLKLREAAGSVLDWLRHLRADGVRAAFQ